MPPAAPPSSAAPAARGTRFPPRSGWLHRCARQSEGLGSTRPDPRSATSHRHPRAIPTDPADQPANNPAPTDQCAPQAPHQRPAAAPHPPAGPHTRARRPKSGPAGAPPPSPPSPWTRNRAPAAAARHAPDPPAETGEPHHRSRSAAAAVRRPPHRDGPAGAPAAWAPRTARQDSSPKRAGPGRTRAVRRGFSSTPAPVTDAPRPSSGCATRASDHSHGPAAED